MMLRRGGSTAWHHHVGRIYTDHYPSIYFQTSFATAPGSENFQTHMVMKHNYGVGIGTVNPQEILHVHKDTGTACVLVSSSTAPQIRFNPNATDTTDNDRSILGQATGNAQFVNSATTGDTILRGNSTGNILFGIATSEKLRIASAGQIGLGGANYGSSGQVLTSGGASGAVSWTTITGTTINNNADNRIITGSGTANTLNGESRLTFDGNSLDISGSGSHPFTPAGGDFRNLTITGNSANSSGFIYLGNGTATTIADFDL